MVFVKRYNPDNKKLFDHIHKMKEPIRTIFYNLWWRNYKTVNNSIVSVIGMTGSGKSLLCLYMCWKLDPTFNADRIIFDPVELVDRLSNSDKKTAFIFEEAEINLSSKSHWSEINQIIVKLFSTIRYRRNYLFVNLPSEKQLDSQARTLRYANIRMNGIFEDKKGMFSSFSWEFLTPPLIADNSKSKDKDMKREPLVIFSRTDQGIIVKKVINEFRFRLPNDPAFKKLVRDYEAKKSEFLKILYKEFKDKLKTITVKNKEVNLKDVLNAIMKNKDKFYIGGKYSVLEIQNTFGLNKTRTREIIKELKQREPATPTKKEIYKAEKDMLKEIRKFMGM